METTYHTHEMWQQVWQEKGAPQKISLIWNTKLIREESVNPIVLKEKKDDKDWRIIHILELQKNKREKKNQPNYWY